VMTNLYQEDVESTRSAEIIQTQNNSSSVFPAPSDHNPAMTDPILDSHATSTVASLSTQSEPTPDVVDLPAVVLLTGVSSIWVTPSSQLKQPPDAVPGQPSLQLKPPPGLILEGVARSPITLKKQWQRTRIHTTDMCNTQPATR